MSDLERIRDWLKGYAGIPPEFQIDYTSEVPGNAGLFPSGMQELLRKEDICGGITVTNQYNFAIYTVLQKTDAEDEQATLNAEWVMDFQQWVQEQSVLGLAPTFGNVDTRRETVKAQNGSFYGSKDTGAGLYMVMISVQFKKKF